MPQLPQRPHLLLGITGSVAAVKWECLCSKLYPFFELRVIFTERSGAFTPLSASYSPHDHECLERIQSFASETENRSLGPSVPSVPSAGPPVGGSGVAEESAEQVAQQGCVEYYRDADEWREYQGVGSSPVLHIELRKWADIFVIAPCTANTLAKLACGLADNLLTCVARAWEFGEDGRVAKPFLIAPAMNSCMWSHPITSTHLSVLQGWGVLVISPIEKVLACGDKGVGAMGEVEAIVMKACEAVKKSSFS